MKKFISIIGLLTAIFGLSLNTVFAQNDSLFIMKDGSVIWESKVADIDSIIFYRPEVGGIETGTFTDARDSTVYKWVRIGEQIWMAENLKYLPSIVVPDTSSNTEPCYYVYDYDSTDVAAAKATENYITYGVLYNWVAVMNGATSSNTNPSGVQGICPAGWHIPSDTEWVQLLDLLGGEAIAGGPLKEAGTEHWAEPNTGATNETGFTALPGGYYNGNGDFCMLSYYNGWWSSTAFDEMCSFGCGVYFDDSEVTHNYAPTHYAFSVRCLKDN
ncbi:MAG TPA: fibrobacter succinogenes major paralogous domain-containing protein [Salinivirgaceae bacterium]|nr:fibrobacter succinogenes major paralogous domain-containing protein [Salinivirgaceae bacterium]